MFIEIIAIFHITLQIEFCYTYASIQMFQIVFYRKTSMNDA